MERSLRGVARELALFRGRGMTGLERKLQLWRVVEAVVRVEFKHRRLLEDKNSLGKIFLRQLCSGRGQTLLLEKLQEAWLPRLLSLPNLLLYSNQDPQNNRQAISF